MANNKIKFLRGTSSEYTAVEKDNDTIYFTTDDGKLYVGDKEVSGKSITIDAALSDTSKNPVQNKVIKTELDKKANITDIPTSLPANGGNADTVGGHTVKADVPANAVFTDTTYEPATSSTDGLMSAADKTILDKRTAYKLVSSSCQTVSINTSDWNTLSSGGYVCEKTLPVGLLYDNYIFDVSLSSDTDAAKLQLQSWNYIMADGRIEQATSSVNGGKAASFTFYAFTTKPTVALTIAIQGVSGS